jgi:hypothetical protein
MSARSLFDPVIDGGIRNPNWFEGRLLTADALRDKDRAERMRERLIGRAIGAGIFEGLMVTRGAADTSGVRKALNITKGAAINGDGDVLMLSQDVTVDVVPPTTPAQPEPKLFGRCEPPPPIAAIPSGFGIYVLVMSPASGYRERAPKSGLGSEGIVTGCGDAFAVDGVRFRLEKLEPGNISGIDAAGRTELTQLIAHSDDDANRSLLRNLMAHYCFGTAELSRFPADPFAMSQGVSDWLGYGALDDLRDLKRLTCCDVAIALLLWNATGVAYLDTWSARRTPIVSPASTLWPLPGARQSVDGLARFLQFQDQLAQIIADSSTPTAIRADHWFRFLPAAGLLPLSGTAKGLQLSTFFLDVPIHDPRPPDYSAADGPVALEGARLRPMLQQSFLYEAPRLASDVAERTALWIYRLRENAFALDTGSGDASAATIAFATAQMPYLATPRFNVARWNYSNFSSSVLGPS